MPALKCRTYVPGGGECLSPGGECDQPAAVGVVLEGETGILELHPICADHAPEEVHEVRSSMAASEWALVSLAYGVADGGLR